MSCYRKELYLREQQRETKFAPRINCKGPHIRNFEKLARAIFYPDHAHPDGTLKEEGIARKDLTHRGFSIYRVKYTTIGTMNNLVDQYVSKNPERRLDNVSTFLACTIRYTNDKDGHQAFVIIDGAPTLDLRGHAIILCAEKHKPSYIKELRREIVQLINNPHPLNAVFPS